MDKYIVVTWPDSQAIMDEDWFDECHLINDDMGLEKFGSSAYFVPEDRYIELINQNI